MEMKRFNTVVWASTVSLVLVACSDATEPDEFIDLVKCSQGVQARPDLAINRIDSAEVEDL